MSWRKILSISLSRRSVVLTRTSVAVAIGFRLRGRSWSSLTGRQPDGNTPFGEVALGLVDRVVSVVKDACRERCARFARRECRVQMLGPACSSAGDDRDVDGVGDSARDFDVVTVLRAVSIHRGQDNLAGPETLDLDCPGHGLETRRDAAAVDVNIPHFATLFADPLRIDVDHNTLASEPKGRLPDEVRIFHGGRVDRHFVAACLEQNTDIIQIADAAPDSQRHKNYLRGTLNHVEHDRALFMAGRDIEKYQFVCSLRLVPSCHFHRVARIPQVEKIHSLDHATGMDVQARNDPFRKHGRTNGDRSEPFGLVQNTPTRRGEPGSELPNCNSYFDPFQGHFQCKRGLHASQRLCFGARSAPRVIKNTATMPAINRIATAQTTVERTEG